MMQIRSGCIIMKHWNVTLDPFCACRTNSIENSQYFLLHCSIYTLMQGILFSTKFKRLILLFTDYTSGYFCLVTKLISNVSNILLKSPIKFNLKWNHIKVEWLALRMNWGLIFKKNMPKLAANFAQRISAKLQPKFSLYKFIERSRGIT